MPVKLQPNFQKITEAIFAVNLYLQKQKQLSQPSNKPKVDH